MASRVALVMGGSTGIGREISLGLLRQGHRVVAASRSEEKLAGLREAAASITTGELLTVPADATRSDQVRKLVEDVHQRYGRIDILVNNQGGSMGLNVPLEQLDEDVWSQLLTLNLTSVFLCCKYVVPIMKEARWGRIVNISSIAGRSMSFFGSVGYSSSKAGVIGLTRHASRELAPYNITINVVAPGVIETDRIRTYWEQRKTEEERQGFLTRVPMGRLGQAREVASAVLYLTSEDASYITGAVIDVNGGVFVG